MEQLSLSGWPEYLSPIADTLGERYDFGNRINEGKTGVAFAILDKTSRRRFCLKTIAEKVPQADRGDVFDSLKKEIAILDPLMHKAIPCIYEREVDGELPYYVCTYHPGETFLDFMKSGKRLSTDKSVFVVSLLIDALEYLHKSGRTHCDFHLNNILIHEEVFAHGVLIIDFGSGHRESDPSHNTVQRGDFRYKKPEDQAKYRATVNRELSGPGFQIADFIAMGDLLAVMANVFFGEAPADRRVAYFRYCQMLQNAQITDWSTAKRRFEGVIDPDFLVTGIDRFFISRHGTRGTIRIPVSRDVPIGEATSSVVDTHEFQRLRNIKQLSFCDWLYPGGAHSRFEHSLGVMNVAHKALTHLARNAEFRDRFTPRNVEGALLAALVHDVGHYPFAHVMEHYVASRFPDNREARDIVHHAKNTLAILDSDGVLRKTIDQHWGEDLRVEAIKILEGHNQVVSELLDGPIDCDKLDYLQRDAHHCGIPFGSGIDLSSVIQSFCPTSNGSRLGITRRGVSAIEGLMIVQEQMLDAVYWHETVRGIVAMFHAVIATLVGQDLGLLSALVQDLKRSSSEQDALRRVLFPRVRQLEGKAEELLPLYRLHLRPEHSAIYHSLKKYTLSDDVPREWTARMSIYRAIIRQQASGTSNIPIDWNAVRRLRQAYKDAFLEKKPHDKISLYDILVDVPWGKASNRMVQVKEDSGEERDICDVSHLDRSIFEQPTMYLAPIRVFISPRLAVEYESYRTAICTSAEARFYDASVPMSLDEGFV